MENPVELQSGDRVALLVPGSADYVELVIGLLAGGVFPVPLDPRLTATERAGILAGLRPRMAVDTDEALAAMRLTSPRRPRVSVATLRRSKQAGLPVEVVEKKSRRTRQSGRSPGNAWTRISSGRRSASRSFPAASSVPLACRSRCGLHQGRFGIVDPGQPRAPVHP